MYDREGGKRCLYWEVAVNKNTYPVIFTLCVNNYFYSA